MTLRCEPFPFQKGDEVITPDGRTGTVTAVGVQWCVDNRKMLGAVYRVGRSLYWYGWQLKKVNNEKRNRTR